WSRSGGGLMSADNRFRLAAIAEALECSIAELTGTPIPPSDRETAAAQTSVHSIRQALIDADLAEPSMVRARALPDLEQETALVRDLHIRCDYAGVGRLLPRLLRELHSASAGIDGQPALRLTVDAMHAASSVLKYLGYPAKSWLAAERCREAAETLEDPVMLAVAAFARACAATACGSFGRGLVIATRAV